MCSVLDLPKFQIMPPKTRNQSGDINPDVLFPLFDKFQQPSKLPTYKSVIGVLKSLTAGGKANHSHEEAVREVAKLLYSKWFHDTVYCLAINTVQDRLRKDWEIFREGRKRFQAGRMTGKGIDAYKELVTNMNSLYDIGYETARGKKSETLKLSCVARCKEEWGVTMSDKEYEYYEDQKSGRLLECDRSVDPVWYHATMRQERLKRRQEEYREHQREQFAFKDMVEIEKILAEEMGALSSPEISPETPAKQATRGSSSSATPAVEPSSTSSKKRKLFLNNREAEESSDFPQDLAYIRHSERIVKDEFYTTVATLLGHGLSFKEANHAVVDVGNGMFRRKWKHPDKESESYDLNTVPEIPNILAKVNLIEAETLSYAVDNIKEAKEAGRMITAAIDSTTKRGVGQFATQGLSIGRDSPFPLPLLPICGESTEDVAAQVAMGMEVLAAVKGVPAREVYKLVDTHMTDSVSHNKGINKELADLYDIEKPAGQLFCGSHTTLGFSGNMDKQVARIEADMKLEHVIKNFMVDLEMDSKNGSFAAQALDMCLRLVSPEYSHKPWNYNKLYVNHLEQQQADITLFCYKDQRFGCLSKSSGVLLHNLPHLKQFLADHPNINNRLACLVREVMDLPYLVVVMATFAAIGIHVIEPFYAKTIDKKSTHSSLKEYYTLLHRDLGKQVTEEFFTFEAPVIESETQELFPGVLAGYGDSVISAVKEVAKDHMEDCLALVNICFPGLQTVLARQRRDYGLSEEFPAEFPVFDQCANPDDTPVNNIAMERQCGTVDYRLHKLRKLTAVSRSMTLAHSQEVRDGRESTFRTYKEQVQAVKVLTMEWKEKIKEKLAKGADMKHIVAQTKERKRLDILDELKESGGPFTSAEEVQVFLQMEDISEKDKQKRMKKEMRFARESSTTLPSADPLFKIQVTLPNGKRRDKTAIEFGESLKVFLGKKVDSTTTMDYNSFRSSLRKFADSDSNNN